MSPLTSPVAELVIAGGRDGVVASGPRGQSVLLAGWGSHGEDGAHKGESGKNGETHVGWVTRMSEIGAGGNELIRAEDR